MRIEISKNGSIMRLNEKGLLHSSESKPSYIEADGRSSWHWNGKLFKYVKLDGPVVGYADLYNCV